MKKVVRKQVVIWLVAIAMLFVLAGNALAAYEVESNNTLATANVYNYGESAAGFVNSSDTVDYWRIDNVPYGWRELSGYTEMSLTVLNSLGYVIATKPVGVYSTTFYMGGTGSVYVVANYTPNSGIYYYGYTVN